MEVVKDAVDGNGWKEMGERKIRGWMSQEFPADFINEQRRERERHWYERKRGSVNFSLLLEPEFNQLIRRTSSKKEKSREKMGETQSLTLTTSFPDLMESG